MLEVLTDGPKLELEEYPPPIIGVRTSEQFAEENGSKALPLLLSVVVIGVVGIFKIFIGIRLPMAVVLIALFINVG